MAYRGDFMFSEARDMDNDPDYVYYNATIINNRTLPRDVTPDPYIRFQETRDMPIIKDASKYQFSIVRFTMNGANKDLPLFIPVIRIGAEANPTQDVNLTIYSVTFSLVVNYENPGGALLPRFQKKFVATQPLIWETETLDPAQAPVPIPESTVNGQDISTRYYWAYTYSHVLRLFANATTACFAQLQALFAQEWTDTFPTDPVPTLDTVPPQMTWNPALGLFTLWCDVNGFGGASRASINTAKDESFEMYFNNNLFGLFSNFDNEYINGFIQGGPYIAEYTPLGPITVGFVPEAVNHILVTNILFQNIQTVVGPTTKQYFLVQQDYESTSTLWNPIESIVFTSALLPLVFEQIGDPIRWGEGNDNASNSGRPAFSPIITDVALTNENANSYRTFILYSPTAEYRMASFQRSKNPINSIDIQVYWKNRLDGQLYPISMFNCSSVSCKFMFRRIGATSKMD